MNAVLLSKKLQSIKSVCGSKYIAYVCLKPLKYILNKWQYFVFLYCALDWIYL